MRTQVGGGRATTSDAGDADSSGRTAADGVNTVRGLPFGFSLATPPWLPSLTLATIVAVGVGLRFVTTSDLWLDEALSVNIATLPVGDLFEALRHDGHPPLYYLLLRGWMRLVGEGDLAVRSLSGIFAVATLPLAWIAGRRRAGITGARWALVIMALSPYAIRYATEARMYSLLMLLVLAGYLLIDDALLRPARWRLAAIALVSGLLLLTHYWAFYLLAALVLVMGWRWWRHRDERRSIGPVLLAVAAGGLLFLPWLPGFWFQATHTGTPWAQPTRPLAIVQRTLGDLGGGNNLPEAIIYGSALLILCLLAVFVARSQDRGLVVDLRTLPTVRRELDVVVLTVALGTVGGYATSSTFESRYAAVLAPLVLLAAAVGLARLPRSARFVAGSAFVVLALPGIVWIQYFERTQAPVVGAAIERSAQPGDVVVYCPDQLGPAYSRATPDGLVERVYPTLGSPERVDWVDYAERNAQADPVAVADEVRALAAGQAIFVVWKGDYATFDAQCETLVDTLAAGSRTERLVIQDGSRYYEPANLFRIAPDPAG
jgi:mannosyltransferase